jgi:transcriptional regulator with XRE-family HTH domain
MTPVPPVRRVLVGSMLRSYREAAGYKLDDAARILECDRSKISRIETGQRGIRPKELRELLTEYNVAASAQDALTVLARPRDANSWWRDYRQMLPDAYLDFTVTEGLASRILVYAPLQVPELLWTRSTAGRSRLPTPPSPKTRSKSPSKRLSRIAERPFCSASLTARSFSGRLPCVTAPPAWMSRVRRWRTWPR